MGTGWLIAFVVFYFVSGVAMSPVSNRIADEKGYNGIIFAVATILFSGIGLLCACALPNKKDETAEAIKELIEKISSPEQPNESSDDSRSATGGSDISRESPVERNAKDIPSRRFVPEAPAAYEDEGEAASLGWRVEEDYPVDEPTPLTRAHASFARRGAATANSILKDGRLVCSACLNPIGFNDAECKHCGAKIVPADDSDGGFFLKKL